MLPSSEDIAAIVPFCATISSNISINLIGLKAFISIMSRKSRTGAVPRVSSYRLGDGGINEQHVERAAVETLSERTNAGLIRDVSGLLLEAGRGARVGIGRKADKVKIGSKVRCRR
jgi:hypothetical protein